MSCDLKELLKKHNVRHFKEHEFGRIGTARGRYKGPRRAMPDDLSVMLPVILVADRLREAWGKSTTVLSSYRPPEYNALLPGASPNSRHMLGLALDLQSEEGFLDFCVQCWEDGSFRRWAKEVEELLDKDGTLTLGFGVYPEKHNRFVHVDAGYQTEPGGRLRDTRFR